MSDTAPSRGSLRSRLVSAVWLLIVWLGISGSYTTASFVGGVIVVTLLIVLFPRLHPSAGRHRVRPVALASYVLHFVVELARANVQVARAVISPTRVRDHRGIVEVPLARSSRLVGAVLANAVSLTPGTSIIEVTEEPPSFHVHVLDLQSVDQVRLSVAELHWRLVRAIGPAEQLDEVGAALEDLRTRVEREVGPT